MSSEMEKLLIKQMLSIDNMDNLWESFQSKEDNLTREICKLYLEELKRSYDQFCQMDEELTNFEDFVTDHDKMKRVLQNYITIKNRMTCRLHEFKPQDTSSNSMDAKVSSREILELPDIILVTFDGDRTCWMDFRNTYKRLVHEANISTVKKMHYLKNCLKGEAADIIAGIPISFDGYSEAWEALLEHYDNPRRLMQIYMEQYFDTPRMDDATSKDIYALLNTKTQLYRALKNMVDPATLIDYLVTYSTIRGLDHDTVQRWEESRENSKAIPKFKELQAFLNNRATGLEILEKLNRKDSRLPKENKSFVGGQRY